MEIEEEKLDHPVWYSLQEEHRELSAEYDNIRFYKPKYCPFGEFIEQDKTTTGINEYSLLT
ncbi:hypothetical protein [Zunongwangia pacifica]|uniref:Uncharacterized protein n=1 Tax=Zunongwangia pacifica TaxID=2911062 RepID=A0A9X1ZSS3_9FLAO|nr:hypothetical protein [Zunongwangia pacifica]MCL6220357.1 hypothetical protein [Zunongwangia pacifica]